jgi:hypothetical protein
MAADPENVAGCLIVLGIVLLVCGCIGYLLWGENLPGIVSIILMGIPAEIILAGLFMGHGKGR